MVYFPRAIDDDLLQWSKDNDHQPLILRGARQTGKTGSVRHLGKSFDYFVELNLDLAADRALVRSCESADQLLAQLAKREDVAGFEPRTLLFIDEIQQDSRAVGWLRYLYEDHPELHVVAAGSLLEMRMTERGFSFPVGRVTFRYLHPLSFLEFLVATGREQYAQNLRSAARQLQPLSRYTHQILNEYFADYLVVGGMPAAVAAWVNKRSTVSARLVHAAISQAFAEDFQKYRSVRDLAYLEAAFENLPNHYGRRFKYEGFATGFKSRPMKTALGRLEAAMICRRVWPTSDFTPPLQIKARAAPKLLPLDVGLTMTTANMPPSQPPATELHALMSGRLAEAVAGQLLLSAERYSRQKSFFWVRQTNQANAEVDYLAGTASGLLPVEVKAGAAGRLKSLHQYLWRAKRRVGIRLHAGNLTDEELEVAMPDGPLKYRLLSLPLYMAELVPELEMKLD